MVKLVCYFELVLRLRVLLLGMSLGPALPVVLSTRESCVQFGEIGVSLINECTWSSLIITCCTFLTELQSLFELFAPQKGARTG
jgi:hypothetical protein